MHAFNRLLAVVVALACVTAGLLLLVVLLTRLPLASLGLPPGPVRLLGELRALEGMPRFWTGLGGAVGIIFGATLFIAEARLPTGDRQLLLRSDAAGIVSVSLTGLRRLADHVAGGVDGVQAVVSEARLTRKGVAFRCRVALDPESSAAELAEEIRSRVGESVRYHTGRAAYRIDVQTRVGGLATLKRRVR